MTKTLTKEQLKELKAPKAHYGVIQLDYSTKIVLPHKLAVAYMDLILQAEILKDDYGSFKRIVSPKMNDVKFTSMSEKEYIKYKTATLLNIDMDAEEEEEDNNNE